MPDFIVLGNDHQWFACFTWNEVQSLAKAMFKNGCEYVKVIRTDEVAHLTKEQFKKEDLV